MPFFDQQDADFKILRQLVARKHEHYPDWTLEQCVHAAVEELNDPRDEPDLAYRQFLIERALQVEGQGDVSGQVRGRNGDDPPRD